MSSWLFNVYVDGVVREVKARVQGQGLVVPGEDGGGSAGYISCCLHKIRPSWLSLEDLRRLVEEFGSVCSKEIASECEDE